MKFIVLGAGAIGCYVGGRLAAAASQTGADVVLVGRQSLLGELRQHGLRVTDLDGANLYVPAEQLKLANSLADAQPDAHSVILLCVKGTGTADAASEIASACPQGVAVISLQNGVENVARIRAGAPSSKPFAGMVPYNVVQAGPGRFHRATEGSICLEDQGPCPQAAPVFRASGLPCELRGDMPAVQWGKLLLNLNNPVNALSDLPLVRQLGQHALRSTLATLQDELLMALAVAGIQPAQVGAVPPRWLPRLLRLPDWLFKRVAARMLRMDPSARSSMWDDLQRGKLTEIDDLCGAVVRLAKAHGLQAPANARMLELVQHQPKGPSKSGQPWSGQSLLAELKSARA
jgi:2-dehydropantoate 2-reductase